MFAHVLAVAPAEDKMAVAAKVMGKFGWQDGQG